MGSALEDASTVCLATFRRDGSSVLTPVSVVGLNGALYVTTGATSGKVKRIRRNPAVRVAPCTFRGRLLGGWQDGMAEVLGDPGLSAQVRKAEQKKYGWLLPLLPHLLRLIFRRYADLVILKLSLRQV
jgi:uncharacterized protein